MTGSESVAFGPARPDLIRDETLADLFGASVAAHSSRPAISGARGALTYRELDEATARLAGALRRRGAGPGAFVGLWIPRGRDVLIAQIAIARTGAAWLPFDADVPPERIRECLADVGALGILLPQRWSARLPTDTLVFEYEALADEAPEPFLPSARPDDPAYVIYTSGSTGRPKGILVANRSICHFLRSAALAYGLDEKDAMLQAGSIAFDLSLEEIWLPLHVGARLEVCPADVLADPERLAALARERGVTAMDVVPTLLGMIEEDLDGVRLIIVGGEACPEAIVRRFATPGRRLVNSYGPSEATVVATATDLEPGRAVTIGRPLANVSVHVVDDALRPVPRGCQGELLIGGPGVALGYVGRPDLTREKFVPNPRHEGTGHDPVLYRTGDAVEMTAEGDLLFRGRIDDQVKIRGFRIELGEVEERLARAEGVTQAAVVVSRASANDQLVGYVLLEPGAAANVAAWKAMLAEQLPPYMIPAVIIAIDTLPRLAASGKVNRAALSDRPLPGVDVGAMEDVDGTDTERRLLELAAPLFSGQPVALDADFFLDLGGHSLLAAQFVSAARRGGIEGLSLNQIYQVRTLRRIAQLVDESAAVGSVAPPAPPERAPAGRRYLCGLAQLAVMPLLLTMQAAPWLAIFISYTLIDSDNAAIVTDLLQVFFAYAGINLALALFAIATKWLIVGRTKPGRYPLWGAYYFRVWLVQRVLSLVHMKWMQNSPILPLYLRALGAKVGRDVLLSDFDAGAIDLLEFGDHASVGSKTVFANARIDGTHMVVGRVRLGADVAVGSSCAIEGDVLVGRASELADLTALRAGTTVPDGEIWDGAPAGKVGEAKPEDLAPPPVQTTLGRGARGLAYLAMLLVLPAIAILPIVPAFRLMEWLDGFVHPVIGVSYLWYMPILALSAGAGLIAITMVLIVAIRWVVLPRVRPGRYPVSGLFYLRRWGVGLMVDAALDTLSSLFATLYMRGWYRLMGCRIGKGTEISTSFAGRYELIRLGAGNFIADDVVFADDHLRRGWLELERTETGDQVFVGNEAVIPQGIHIGTGALVGVKSKPPAGKDIGAGETWFGSPALGLPTRQRFDHDVRETFDPPLRRKIGRAAFEAFNITLPTALFITLVTIVMEVLAPVFDRQNWGKALWICVLASTLISLVQLAVGAAYKWLLMGRYRPTVRPMWSWWALRTEAVAVMYWAMAGKALLDLLRGTPFLPVALRLFGVRTGRGAYLDSADITEFDCVVIGDDAVLNNHAVLQTHLYEDRLMKVGYIRVGNGVVIGAGSTVLYDTALGDDARLGPLTLVMKGEEIPSSSSFEGAPARQTFYAS